MAKRIAAAIAAAALGIMPLASARAGVQADLVDAYAMALGLSDEGHSLAPGEGPLVLAASSLNETELAGLRGGFALPSGLDVAFGFDIETRLAGAVVQRLTLPVSQLGAGTPRIEVFDAGNVVSVLPNAGPVVVDRTFDGGATRIMTALGGGLTSLVQNSRDGALVQRRATFQVDVAGMARMLDAAASRRMIGEALAGGTRR